MKKALWQLHLAVFLVGFTGILGRLIKLNEGWLVWYRLLLTVIIIGAVLLFTRGFVRLKGRPLFQLLGVGAVIAFHWVAFYGSIKYANASVALVCFSLNGFFTAIFEPILLRKRIVWAELLLGLLSLAGIYIIFDFNPHFKTGIIFGVIATVGSSIFPILNKQLVGTQPPRLMTFYEMTGALLFLSLLLPLYLYFFPASYHIPTLPDLGWLLILVVFCTAIAFELQLKALKHVSAFTSNLTYSLEPVYGIILAVVFLGEGKDFNNSFIAGLSLVVLAVVLQMRRVSRK